MRLMSEESRTSNQGFLLQLAILQCSNTHRSIAASKNRARLDIFKLLPDEPKNTAMSSKLRKSSAEHHHATHTTNPPDPARTEKQADGSDLAVWNQHVNSSRYEHAIPEMHTLGNAFLQRVLGPSRVSVVQRAGWKDAQTTGAKSKLTTPPQGGWNQDEFVVEGIRRIPIDGLKLGNQDKSPNKRIPVMDPDDPKKQLVIDKKPQWKWVPAPTKESAAGVAIVLIPEGIDETQPIEALLHLHGHGSGYRQNDDGTVRDVEVDHTVQQLKAVTMNPPSGAGKKPTVKRQLIAVLPQESWLSGLGSNFDSQAYLTEVFQRLNTLKVWGKDKTGPTAASSVILSAHSGGGGGVAEMMPGKGAKRPNKLPHNLSELTLSDGINGPNELETVTTYLTQRLEDDKKALSALAPTGKDAKEVEKDQLAYLKTSFRFRGYYGAKGTYITRYTTLQGSLKDWFLANTTALGGASSPVYAGLWENYTIVPIDKAGVGHENIMSATLQDALTPGATSGTHPAPPQPPPPPPPKPTKKGKR